MSLRKFQNDTAAAILAVAALFSLFFPFSTFASSSFFAGTAAFVYPCLNLSGSSLISIKNGNASTLLVYQKGFSRSALGTTSPQKGDTLYGISESGVRCISLGLMSSSQAILFYATTTPDKLPKNSNGKDVVQSSNPSIFGALFSSLSSVLSNFLSNSLSSGGLTVSVGITNSGGASGTGSVSVTTPFGGQIVSPPIPCIDPPGSWIVTLGPPTPGIYKYIPLVTTTYSYGPPLVPGQWTLGQAVPEVCVTAPGVPPIPVMLMMSVGTSLAPSSGAATPTPTKSSGNYCKNNTYNQFTQDALQQYGGNLLSGNVPGLQSFCPNFNNLSTAQRTSFWTNFVNAVELPESGCNPNSSFREANGQLSQGLLQLSYGDSAKGAPGACQFSGGILDPQSNITCGVAIMNGLSSNGITNGNKGMDAYWSTLRSGKASLANVQAVMSSFPGCH